MKKLATLLIAAGLVFGVTTGASAIDFKAKGQWIMSFDYGQNGNFTGGHGQTGYGKSNEDEFEARQRIRLQLDAVASESLSGTVFFEIGDSLWGDGDTGGALGADGKIVEVKRAYIDWIVPETELKVRMGIQGIAAPAFALKRSQSFGGDVAGVTLNYTFNENVGVTAFWARPFNDNYDGSGTVGSYQANYMDNIDVFGLMIPLTFDGVKVTPWGMIAAIGPNALRNGDDYFGANSSWGGNYNRALQGMIPAWGVIGSNGLTTDQVRLDNYGTAWWAGLTGDITMFDPFRVAFDFTYGGVDYDNDRLNRSGWMVAALFEYKFDWGIPGIIGWYASGDNSDLGDGSERLPTLGTNMGDNDFSHYAFDGNPWIAREGVIGESMAGTWGVGLRVRDVSFVENLKHTLRVNLIGGTNDNKIFKELARSGSVVYTNRSGNLGFESLYLTDQDTALEIGLYNEYQMYENFKVSLDANYMALWLSDTKYNGVRRQLMGATADSETRDAWNINVSFAYEF